MRKMGEIKDFLKNLPVFLIIWSSVLLILFRTWSYECKQNSSSLLSLTPYQNSVYTLHICLCRYNMPTCYNHIYATPETKIILVIVTDADGIVSQRTDAFSQQKQSLLCPPVPQKPFSLLSCDPPIEEWCCWRFVKLESHFTYFLFVTCILLYICKTKQNFDLALFCTSDLFIKGFQNSMYKVRVRWVISSTGTKKGVSLKACEVPHFVLLNKMKFSRIFTQFK